jgi:hypothetical protein
MVGDIVLIPRGPEHRLPSATSLRPRTNQENSLRGRGFFDWA